MVGGELNEGEGRDGKGGEMVENGGQGSIQDFLLGGGEHIYRMCRN